MVVAHEIGKLDALDPAILLLALPNPLHLDMAGSVYAIYAVSFYLLGTGSRKHVGELAGIVIVSIVGDSREALLCTRHSIFVTLGAIINE